jgi:choline dehydrogenase-like flavoprotein
LNTDSAPRADTIRSEVVVIGSGPSGAITATLCAEAGRGVLLLEEGEHLPLESAEHFSQEELLQKYRNGGVSIAFGRAKIAYVEGRCVGGGSEINRGLYHRTPETLLERWRAEFGVRDLTSEILAPHFEDCERTARVEYLPGSAPLLSSRLHDGAVRLGWRSMEAPRLVTYGGATAAPRKQSMSATFVPRFLAAGGHLQADTRVRRIARIGGRWRLEASTGTPGGGRRTLEVVADTVFVACGAVQTPALLRRSGIKRNIGNTLRLHPMLKVVALFDEAVNQPGGWDPVHQVREFEPRFGIGCSISAKPLLALAMAPHPEHLPMVDECWRHMAIYYVQAASGPATVRNLPGFRDPFVSIRQSTGDLETLAEGLRRLSEVLFAAGAKRLFPSIAGYPVLESPNDIAKLPQSLRDRDYNATSVHVFSSCPMGEDEARCAADSFGRLPGADGLRIADASLLCTATVVNPQGTVMAIAHRNAQRAIEEGFR